MSADQQVFRYTAKNCNTFILPFRCRRGKVGTVQWAEVSWGHQARTP